MKKSLVALAALAVTGAFAQSSVTIDGVYDAGYQSIDYKGNKVNGIGGNGSSTSQLTFRGTEDLGGGMKATFRVETDWNTVFNRGNTGAASAVNTGATTVANSAAGSFANGEIRGGLVGGFGTVDFGVVNMNTLSTYLTGQPFGTAIGGGYGSVARVNAAGNAVRSDNSVKYASPSFSGFNVTLYKANKQNVGANANDNFSTTFGRTALTGSQEFGLNYANGPIAASFSNLKQDNTGVVAATGGAAGTTQSTVNTLGANYSFGAAKLFGLRQTNKTDTSSTNTTHMTLSGTYTMGNTVLMAQTGSMKNNNNGLKSSLLGLGADYMLSKTTALYARHESIKDDAGVVSVAGFTAAAGNVTRTRTALGVRIGF